MQRATVDRMVEWAEREFADREWVQKDELLAAAREGGLPGDAQRALRELPQARWRRDEMLYLVGTLGGRQERSKMREPVDGVPGGGHEGEPEA